MQLLSLYKDNNMKCRKISSLVLAWLTSSLLLCCITTTTISAFSQSQSQSPIRVGSSSIIGSSTIKINNGRRRITTTTNSNARYSSSGRTSSWASALTATSTRRRLSLVTLYSSKQPPTPEFFKGAPSTPGFKPGQFEKLSSWAVSTASNRPVVAEYDPDGLWLWTQWDGTIRQMTYQNVILSVAWSIVVDLYCYQHYSLYLIAAAAVNGGDVTSLIGGLSWASFEIPHSKDPIIDTLTALNSLWEYQLSLAVFVLSFFVNHAYSSWRSVYFCTRAIQGRINDLCMLVTMAAKRSAHYGDIDGVTGYDTNIDVDANSNVVTTSNTHRDAKKLVQDVTRMLRMSHTLFWAATPTCSDGLGDVDDGSFDYDDDNSDLPLYFDRSEFGPMLLSTAGLEMLVECGQLTENEMKALVATGLPPSQYPYALLEWAGLRCIDGMEQGELRGGPGMEENLLRNFSQLRAEYFSIGDFAAGRMPMAYVQFMEVLVDTLIFLAPLALYVKMGTFNIISTALLTLFFKGLLELSKSFLDPFGREGYRAHNIRVDVLVSEMNFGASSRWVAAGDALPSDLLERSESTQTTQAGPPFTSDAADSSSSADRMAQDYDLLSKGGTDVALGYDSLSKGSGMDRSMTTGVRDNVQGSGNLSGGKELNGDSSGGAEGSDTGDLHDTEHLGSP